MFGLILGWVGLDPGSLGWFWVGLGRFGLGWVEAREVWVRLNLGSLCVLGKPELNKNWLLHRWRFVQSHNTGTLVIFTLSLMCCVYERSPTSLSFWSVERICREWLRCHAFFCRHLFPMAFLSPLCPFFLLRNKWCWEWRGPHITKAWLIGLWRFLAKEILGFKCVLSDIFLVRVAFFENLCLAHLNYKCDQKNV